MCIIRTCTYCYNIDKYFVRTVRTCKKTKNNTNLCLQTLKQNKKQYYNSCREQTISYEQTYALELIPRIRIDKKKEIEAKMAKKVFKSLLLILTRNYKYMYLL